MIPRVICVYLYICIYFPFILIIYLDIFDFLNRRKIKHSGYIDSLFKVLNYAVINYGIKSCLKIELTSLV